MGNQPRSQIRRGLGYKYQYNRNSIDIKDSFDNKLLTINFDYDGKVTSIEDIDGNSISYTYSGDNIISVTDRNGDSTTI